MRDLGGRPLRRRTAIAALGLLPLAACASPARPAGGSTTRSVPHRWGTTDVPREPARVVALGLGDLETTLALGVDPVGGSDVFGGRDQLRPWVAAAVDGPTPALLDWRDPSLEQVATLRPDVILYTNAPGDRRVFDQLSRIAPTVAAPADSDVGFGVPWRAQARLVGTVLGLESRAERVVDAVDALVRATRARHPELVGPRATAGLVLDGVVHLWPAVDPRVRLLGELGLRLDGQPALPTGGGYLVPVSPERYDVLESEVLYLACTDDEGRVDAALRASPTFARLDVVRRGRVVYAPGPAAVAGRGPLSDYASAFGTGGPLGIPACLPRLEADLTRVLRP